MIEKGDFVIYQKEIYEVINIAGSTLALQPVGTSVKREVSEYKISGDSITTTATTHQPSTFAPMSLCEKAELGDLLFKNEI